MSVVTLLYATGNDLTVDNFWNQDGSRMKYYKQAISPFPKMLSTLYQKDNFISPDTKEVFLASEFVNWYTLKEQVKRMSK